MSDEKGHFKWIMRFNLLFLVVVDVLPENS